jgi:hypothetical protein
MQQDAEHEQHRKKDQPAWQGFQGPSKHERPLSSGQHPSFSIFRLVDRIFSPWIVMGFPK